MVFTDWRFFIFFGIVFFIYWAIRQNHFRKLWLLAASIIFYAAWDRRFLALVFLVIITAYLTPLALIRFDGFRRRAILACGIILSLSVLGYFKYRGFFLDNISDLIQIPKRTKAIILPLGISFYTFHSLSYMIDAYRGKIKPTKNIIDIALYILFFPQLIAGPIVRATDLLPQMQTARSITATVIKNCVALFLIGYFKKAVISDNLSTVVDAFFAKPETYGGGDAVAAMVFYTAQIYCDFSGYTDMAIAAAGLLGYVLKPNFRHPYLASSPIEFWRRWHMSLSFWLRDYLYIPLGGSRGGLVSQSRNVMITMLLGGLWHGASWTFVAWGAAHGAGLVCCRAYQRLRDGLGRARDGAVYSLPGNLLTFVFVALAWVLFRSDSFATAATAYERIAVVALPTLVPWSSFLAICLTLGLLHILSYRVDLPAAVQKCNDLAFACACGSAVALILPWINVKVKPFIYFQF